MPASLAKATFDFIIMNVRFNQSGNFPPEELRVYVEDFDMIIQVPCRDICKDFWKKLVGRITKIAASEKLNIKTLIPFIPKRLIVDISGEGTSDVKICIINLPIVTFSFSELNLICLFNFLAEDTNIFFQKHSFVIFAISEPLVKFMAHELFKKYRSFAFINLNGKKVDKKTLEIITRSHKKLLTELLTRTMIIIATKLIFFYLICRMIVL